MKKIVIKLGNGDLDSGFNSVNIELKGGDRTPWQDLCSLRPAPELKSSLDRWELLYSEIVRLNRVDFSRGVTFADSAVTNVSIQDLRNLHDRLKIELNKWLAASDFYRIEKSLRTKLTADEEIVIIVQASQRAIWQLPWYLWDFFTDYPFAVEVFSKPQNIDVSNSRYEPNGKVDILALFGTDPQLNLDRDFQCLKSLPDVCLHAFETTSAQDIVDRLQQDAPDILYMSGHGESVEYANDRDGIIYLNPQLPLEISTLKTAVKTAVDLGLQIAIFNCCSGLGIAHQLSDVHLPYLIVMRAEIPNRIAQDFIEQLLTEYSNGADFVRAFQLARDRLSISTESWLKFANWLPVLFHNPLSHPVSWQDAIGTKKSGFITEFQRTISLPKSKLWTSLGLSLILTGLSMGVKSSQPIVRLENIAIDLLSQLQPPQDRQLVSIEYKPIRVLGKLNDPTLLTTTIDKIDRYTKPQAYIADSHLAKYLSPNSSAHQWKLHQQIVPRLQSIKIESIAELSPTQIEVLFNGKIVIVGEIENLIDRALTANRPDLNSDLNLLKIPSHLEEFIWIFSWCNLSIWAVWQLGARKFVPTIFVVVSSQIICGGVLLMMGNGIPIILTSIGSICAGTIGLYLGCKPPKSTQN